MPEVVIGNNIHLFISSTSEYRVTNYFLISAFYYWQGDARDLLNNINSESKISFQERTHARKRTCTHTYIE